MTERISGTVTDIRREDDRQAGYNTMYVIDVHGREEHAIDFGDYGGTRPKVGDQVVMIGRRSTTYGHLEIQSIEV